MSTQPLTVNVPSQLYDQLKRRAESARRSVKEETLEVLATAVPAATTLPTELARTLESLRTFDDAKLREIALSQLADGVSEEQEMLHIKQQREGLSEEESTRLGELVDQYERQMVIRAQAVALLKERGHGVDELIRS